MTTQRGRRTRAKGDACKEKKHTGNKKARALWGKKLSEEKHQTVFALALAFAGWLLTAANDPGPITQPRIDAASLFFPFFPFPEPSQAAATVYCDEARWTRPSLEKEKNHPKAGWGHYDHNNNNNSN
nr:hypothetical protein [Pandoravirus massiliensis]